MEIIILIVLVGGIILAPPPVKAVLKWMFLVTLGVLTVVMFFPLIRRFFTGGF